MSGSRVPNEPPPSYSQATGSSSTAGPSAGSSSSTHSDISRLNVPGASGKGSKDGIPPAYRRSMEDEGRPLPEGWVRTYDPKNHHQFFVDTTKEPPKSIWHHPYDDDEYLASLPSEERERIEQDTMNRHKNPTKEDIIGAHSDDDDDHHHATTSANSELPPRPDGKGKQSDNRTFGRKFKDKVTGTTHAERVEERRQRAEAEQRMYEQHLKIREAMTRAMQTGQPQYLGKDRDGKDVYMQPPPPAPQGAFGGGSYGYNPYSSGIYSTPSARYITPQSPYNRGYGYGGGFGGGGFNAPLAIGGGLLGGLLLGDLLF